MRLDRFDILVSLGLLLLSVAIYAPTAQFEFLAFDDDHYVTRNALIQEGPESYGYGARMAPEPCRAGADIIPCSKF